MPAHQRLDGDPRLKSMDQTPADVRSSSSGPVAERRDDHVGRRGRSDVERSTRTDKLGGGRGRWYSEHAV